MVVWVGKGARLCCISEGLLSEVDYCDYWSYWNRIAYISGISYFFFDIIKSQEAVGLQGIIEKAWLLSLDVTKAGTTDGTD